MAEVSISRYRTQMRFAFLEAVRDTEINVKRHELIPEDTGRLRRGIDMNITDTTGDRMTAVFKSTALSREGNTDYPAILNELPRIAPNKAKFLAFEVRGQQVFSKGFPNVHHRWWDRLWADHSVFFEPMQAEIIRRF